MYANPCNFVLVLTRLEPGQNCKDLYGITGARKGQYLIPKLQQDIDFWQVSITYAPSGNQLLLCVASVVK